MTIQSTRHGRICNFVRSDLQFRSVGFAISFGRICNPTVPNIGIYNPATTFTSHYKCLYSLPSFSTTKLTRTRPCTPNSWQSFGERRRAPPCASRKSTALISEERAVLSRRACRVGNRGTFFPSPFCRICNPTACNISIFNAKTEYRDCKSLHSPRADFKSARTAVVGSRTPFARILNIET